MRFGDLDAAVKDIFHKVFDARPEEITDDTGWGDLERWDSLGHIELLDALQREFLIEIPPEQGLELGTVRDIKRILSESSSETRG